MNASSSFAAVTFFTVFKMCRDRVNAASVPAAQVRGNDRLALSLFRGLSALRTQLPLWVRKQRRGCCEGEMNKKKTFVIVLVFIVGLSFAESSS